MTIRKGAIENMQHQSEKIMYLNPFFHQKNSKQKKKNSISSKLRKLIEEEVLAILHLKKVKKKKPELNTERININTYTIANSMLVEKQIILGKKVQRKGILSNI